MSQPGGIKQGPPGGRKRRRTPHGKHQHQFPGGGPGDEGWVCVKRLPGRRVRRRQRSPGYPGSSL